MRHQASCLVEMLRDPYTARLYIAKSLFSSPVQYFLRCSSWDADLQCMTSSDIAPLGSDPEGFIRYINERSYYIAEELVYLATMAKIEEPEQALEEIFWSYVDLDVRRSCEWVMHRHERVVPKTMSRAEEEAVAREVHSFDYRRLHYMFYGAIDQSSHTKMSGKLARRLLGMSRDEREQYFLAAEQQTYFGDEIRDYLFSIFNMPFYFRSLVARLVPQALDSEKVDHYFEKELCELAEDKQFWQGLLRDDCLPKYLRRYLALWVDYDYGPRQFADEYVRQFINSRRDFQFPEKTHKVPESEVETVLGKSMAELLKMSDGKLRGLFKKKAMQLHPDQGGDHEEFIRLTEAYDTLISKRG